MYHLKSVDDSILGHLSWDNEINEWNSEIKLLDGSVFSFSISPQDYSIPLEQQGLDEIRKCIQWLKLNELELRNKVSDALFDWWYGTWFDEEIDTVKTKQGFAQTISLEGVNIYEDLQAHVYYNDGDIIGGHSIELTIDSDGNIIDTPHIAG